MKSFTKKRRRLQRGSAAPESFGGFKRDPFEAVPVRNARAQHRVDSNSCYQIRMRLDPGHGVKALIAGRLGFHRDVRVNLDERGTFYWSQVNGKQNLESIEKKLRSKFALDADESRTATLMFTKMLMLRHLVYLDVGSVQDLAASPALEAVTNE